MKKWHVVAGILLVATLVIVALPMSGTDKKAMQAGQEASLDLPALQELQAKLEKLQAQLQADLARVQAELQARLAKVQAEAAVLREREWAEAQKALRAHAIEIQERAQAEAKELAGHARELAELAATEAQEIVLEDGESGWLGVSISEVTAERAKELKLPAERGVYINEVEKDSPAEKAGLKAGDVITAFAGQQVEGTVQFRRLVRETLAGRTVALTVWREGRAQNLNVTLSTRRDSIRGRVSVMPDFRLDLEPMLRYRIEPRIEQLFRYSATPRLGIGGQDLSGQLGQYFGAPEGAGVLVTEVAAGTPAEKAGIKAGDVIIKMDGVRVRNLEDLRERMRAAREKGSTSVTLLRKGSEMTLNVQIEKPEPLRRPTVSRRIAI